MNDKNYQPLLNVLDTEIAIKLVKDTFENKLRETLNLIRVSAPLFVKPESGLNDNLNGFEKAVSFKAKAIKNGKIEIVQSLAKWKRNALGKYQFPFQYGIYTDMNAIRPFEKIDAIHSIYVDQWDWEKPITKDLRNIAYLKEIVNKIYKALYETEQVVCTKYDLLKPVLPEEIFFISSEELLKMYPNKDAKARELEIVKTKKAVFIYGIGWPLSNGEPHDLRAADYDDWNLNGDIIVYDEILNVALELSSMGIRVDEKTIVAQLEYKKETKKLALPYTKNVINGTLPYTIGGGIGQSRMCMFLLKKHHIGEVQSSVWSVEEIDEVSKQGIELL